MQPPLAKAKRKWTTPRWPSQRLWLLGAVVACCRVFHNHFSYTTRSLRSTIEEPKPAPKRTAVVFPTLGITSACEAARLSKLVETAGMDVWVLHAFHELQERGRKKDIKVSKDYIRSIPGLQRWPQTFRGYKEFDWASGSSKSSFLRFMAQHPEYDYAWLVEDDVYYTGSWDHLLSVDDNTTDFLTARISTNEGRIRDSILGCQILGKQCSDFESIQLGWELARVSSRLAKSLFHDLEHGEIKGHHESILAPYSTMKNCTYGLMDVRSKIKGRLDVALLHPYKCGDYHDTSEEGVKLSAKSLLTLINAQM
jgi:hypothetical protein